MDTPILATKLYVPAPRPDLIPRPRLLRRLEDGLSSGCHLTLVSAPAGFGKTTLLCEWAQACTRSLAWLTLDEGDNDPVRFWRYFIAALKRIEPVFGDDLLPALQSTPPLPVEVLVAGLINALAGVETPFLLVLEEYHLIANEEIHAGLNFLLNHMPEPLSLVISTRADPPLQLSRRRARREINEIRAADLRFELKDVDTLFNTAMRLNLAAEEIAALENRTEGWAAGLQMAALSLQNRSDAHAFIQNFMGDDRYIADYLLEEVLQRQPEEIQSFLLETSILDRLSAPLCDAVTGRSDSQAVLTALERENLFILPLDNHREWFRYHRLFAGLLRQSLASGQGAEAVKGLQKKAAMWFLQVGNFSEGVDYALGCGDSRVIAGVILSASPEMFQKSELITVLNWGDRTPRNVLADQPGLGFMFAWAAHATGHSQKAVYYLEVLDQVMGVLLDASRVGFADPAVPASARAALAEASVMRARIALDEMDTAHALAIGRVVLPYLMADHSGESFSFNTPENLRSPMLFTMGLAYKMDGNPTDAGRYFPLAMDEARKSGNIHVLAVSMANLGDTQMIQGHLNEAEATFELVLRSEREYQLSQSAFFGMALVGLGNIALERNDLEKAREFLAKGIEHARLWKLWECLLPGYVGMARLECILGNWEAAGVALDALEAAGENAEAVVRPAVALWRARWNLLQGRLEAAGAWARTSGLAALLNGEPAGSQESQAALPQEREEEALTLARVLLAQGRADEAARLAGRVAEQSAAGERWGRAIAARIFQAVAVRGSERDAGDILLKALTLAEPGGYVRIFLDEGEPIRTLLGGMSRKDSEFEPYIRAYLHRLLTAFNGKAGGPMPQQPAQIQQGLVEPLSERELEVLRLVAGGATNPEIAQKEFISVNTVKKHITNIYGKLGVTTRVQAVEMARKLGMI
jgi:LuxR family maltose regulon positive regulatory protein